MATYICCKSGLQIKCSHFPMHLNELNTKVHHPVFDLGLSRLFRYLPRWQNGDLTHEDAYLLALALLDSTDLVEFRVSAQFNSEETPHIIQNNLEHLFKAIHQIASIKNPGVLFPRFCISPDTRSLGNIKHWIEIWNEKYTEFQEGCKNQAKRSELERKEKGLEKLIRNPSLKPERYAHILADWAASASSFPTFTITHPLTKETMSCSDYWKELIQKCYREMDIINIELKDLIELKEHCETNLDDSLGTIFSHHLFTTLRSAIITLENFWGNGSPTYSLLSDTQSGNNEVGEANLKVIVDNAPTQKPERSQYSNEFKYLRAKMAWDISQKEGN